MSQNQIVDHLRAIESQPRTSDKAATSLKSGPFGYLTISNWNYGSARNTYVLTERNMRRFYTQIPKGV